jgi:hypothetical protein
MDKRYWKGTASLLYLDIKDKNSKQQQTTTTTTTTAAATIRVTI